MGKPEKATAHNPEAIIRKVLARYQAHTSRNAMARATLVVDENVEFLAVPLKEANFHIIVPRKGMKDPEIKMAMLAHRTLVTRNTKDFLDDAPILDYGIIGLEALAFLDPEPKLAKNRTAQLISKAISRFNLVSEKSGYVLMLKPNGRHVYKHLE